MPVASLIFKATSEASADTAAKTVPANGQTILVVDDDPALAEFVSDVVRPPAPPPDRP